MRYIDADALKTSLIETLEVLRKNPKMDNQEAHLIAGFSMLGKMVDNAKTVDAVPVVRCKDCIFYDQPHVIKDGKRYEYSEMPKDAIEWGMVSCEYGYNVGGSCCVDYVKGYSEDKRVFVSKDNYCGRAVARKKVTE